jgi:putative pyruvate formate lyase activating enzyme
MNLQAAELKRRAGELELLMSPCRLCPCACGVDRMNGERGRCGVGASAKVACSGPHHGEEPPLVGVAGSGTVFFSGCSLSCIYCQNAQISHYVEGTYVSTEELAAIFLHLQSSGCHNLNLVTPTHQAHAIVEALARSADKGFDLPIVWNCGGYESLAVLRLLDGVVDVYMPDFKYGASGVGVRLSGVSDYVTIAQEAIVEMHRQVGDLVIDSDGIARRGLLVRHLVLPEGLAGTESVMRFISAEVSMDTYVNVMDQYQPCHRAEEVREISRTCDQEELAAAVECARRAGLKRLA